MVYIRRYLSGQQATTVTIAQDAITSDKIVDGAVTHPKISPGAVDSERIIDGSIQSEDIGAGQVKAVDLAPNAVTTDKILDGAVTTQKLEASIQGIARPLTPGVDTVEIQDAKVTLAKLAPDSVDASKIKSGAVGPTELAADAVEESRVKDGAISRAKIAGSAIDATKIAVDAVTGSEILNGSVGHTELASGSVRTVKILDRNVTLDKMGLDSVDGSKLVVNAVGESRLATDALSRRHLESFRVKKRCFVDDRNEPIPGSAWIYTGDPGGRWVESTHGRSLLTAMALNNKQRIDLGRHNDNQTILETLPALDVGIGYGTDRNYVEHLIGLYKDDNNYIAFYAEELVGADVTWKAKCIKGGVSTVVDTGISPSPAAGHVQILKILVEAANSVRFYIDGIEKVQVTDSQFVPDVEYNLRLQVKAKDGNERGLCYRFIMLFEDRWPYGA